MAAPSEDGLKRSLLRKSWVCARAVAYDLRTGLRTALGRFGGESGSTHRGLSVEDSVRYIRLVFDDYFLYGSVRLDQLNGLRILEVGPGDSPGVALLMVAAGAEQVVGLDAFDSVRDEEHHRRVLAALRATVPDAWRPRFDAACDVRTGEIDPDRVRMLTGIPLERAGCAFEAASFDWIVSRAVLEETSDVRLSLRVMDALLRLGGALTHKVDLRDYGLFSARGFHPLESYTVPEWIYRRMSRHSGIPNRQPLSVYRDELTALGYALTVRYTHLTGQERELLPHPEAIPDTPEAERARRLAAAIRPRLAKGLRAVPDEDLVAAGVFLDARKPAR